MVKCRWVSDMVDTKIILKHESPDFGKRKSDGTWGIRTDSKIYALLVNGTEVIDLSVEYERYDERTPSYSCAHISYANRFFLQDSEFNNKGYATQALDTVTESILREGKVPKISVNIPSDNLISQRVAEKAGYIPVKDDEYAVYNPYALKMTEAALSPLQEKDPESYDTHMRSFLGDYKSYIENIIKKTQVLLNKRRSGNGN